MALGNGIKSLTDSEKLNINVARKSIVACKNINKGEQYTFENLTLKRPGTGLPPVFLEYLIGKTSNKNYKCDEQVDF